YKDLAPLNPHLVNAYGQWKDLYAGDEINLPDDRESDSPDLAWVDRLRARGYVVMPGEPPPAPPGPTSPPIAKPGPRPVGCGAHHPQHPHAEVHHRRGRERRVEVVFFAAGEETEAVCAHDGACDASQCQLYDPREFDFHYTFDFDDDVGDLSIDVVDDQ